MAKKTSVKDVKTLHAKRGNIHLTLKTTKAKAILTQMGTAIAPRVSSYLGGVSVVPMVTECKQVRGKWRLMLSVPANTDTTGFDTFDTRGADKRIWSVPMKMMTRDHVIDGFLMQVREYYNSSRIDERGDVVIRLIFKKQEESQAMLELAKESGVIAKPVQKPRKGKAVPGINIVLPLTNMTSLQKAERVVEGFDSVTVKDFFIKIIGDLPKDGKRQFVGTALSDFSREELIGFIADSLPEGVGLYNTEQPFNQDGQGVKINTIGRGEG